MVMKKLNNKGYMLVEIILAFALAFGLAYFILDLTIKLKNKNDDLLVETLVMTDQAIITNKLMEYAMNPNTGGENFSCDIKKENNAIVYTDSEGNKETIVHINEYTKVGEISCDTSVKGQIKILIPLDIKQISDKDFNVDINYKYKISDTVAPECSLKLESNKIVFENKKDNYEVTSYGLKKTTSANEEPIYNNIDSLSIEAGTFTGYVKDIANNPGTCSIKIEKTSAKCPSGYSDSNSGCRRVSYYNCTCSCCNWSHCVGHAFYVYTTSSSSGCSSCGSACYSSSGDWWSHSSSPVYTYAGYEYYCKSGTKYNNSYCIIK